MAKAWAKQFYSSKAWQDCRNAYAAKAHYLCENCLAKGIYKPGEIVHHVIELDPVNIENPEVSLNFDNLELLCRDCHAEKHEHSGLGWDKVNARRREEKFQKKRYRVDANGKIFAK